MIFLFSQQEGWIQPIFFWLFVVCWFWKQLEWLGIVIRGAILTLVVPSLHNDGWVLALGSPDPIHAEPAGHSFKKEKIIMTGEAVIKVATLMVMT